MSRQHDARPTALSVNVRKQIGMVICFGAAIYLLVAAIGLLRHAGAEADRARAYARAPLCTTQTVKYDCRLLVPASVAGTRHDANGTLFHLLPAGRRPVDFHIPSNQALFQELRARQSVLVEYWRGQVTALRDRAGNSEQSYGTPSAFSENDSVGAAGVLFFGLVLVVLGITLSRLPVNLAHGGGPGRYSLPYTIRPRQRAQYILFAAPALAWFIPALLDSMAQPSFNLGTFLAELGSSAVFALFVAAVIVLFGAWYLENRIELTQQGITYTTLFSTGRIDFDEIERWRVRNRRRTKKVQYVDLYRRDKGKPMRLQMDMHWRRSREILLDVLRRHVPHEEDRAERVAKS
jgi:hypothetical protein